MLVRERKPLAPDWLSRMVPRPKRGNRYGESEIDVTGEHGHTFRLIARRNNSRPQDFSVVLIFIDSDGERYILRRNNGAHNSKHTNKIEKEYGLSNPVIASGSFHRHFATERYQTSGQSIDGYAEPAIDYHDFDSALGDLLDKCGFVRPVGGSRQTGRGGAS